MASSNDDFPDISHDDGENDHHLRSHHTFHSSRISGTSPRRAAAPAYKEKYVRLNWGNLRGRDWEEVAETVCGRGDKQTSCKIVGQCKNKIDNLKNRYKIELPRMDTDRSGGGGGNSVYMLRQPKRYVANCAALTNNIKSKSMPAPKWPRVVSKLSGTPLAGNCQNVDPKVVWQIARDMSTSCCLRIEVAIVVGARNTFCGDSWVMNSVLLQSALEKLGFQAHVQSAFPMLDVGELYSRQLAIRHLEKERVVIFGGIGAGTGNPLFTTDTAVALRASELNAEAVIKGTNVDGIYDCMSGDNSVIIDHISFREIVSMGITAVDMMAMQYCEENGIRGWFNLSIHWTPKTFVRNTEFLGLISFFFLLANVVFNPLEPGYISRALCGNQIAL
ncbi:UMP kinase [Bertholletia excelsa]